MIFANAVRSLCGVCHDCCSSLFEVYLIPSLQHFAILDARFRFPVVRAISSRRISPRVCEDRRLSLRDFKSHSAKVSLSSSLAHAHRILHCSRNGDVSGGNITHNDIDHVS
ncbi:hypothetical protein KIN20_005726 [Parelaphostrongylus tenuis]|uniref:Uncharacterized protein n=1 Tax=Parelaphostrongylus tenuis TaxID=148309 RepID=A0AAD5MLJ0_PARTN|nr:hypothetical protein KIN20_005726 [Parelaphostrongylus tenuis]